MVQVIVINYGFKLHFDCKEIFLMPLVLGNSNSKYGSSDPCYNCSITDRLLYLWCGILVYLHGQLAGDAAASYRTVRRADPLQSSYSDILHWDTKNVGYPLCDL